MESKEYFEKVIAMGRRNWLQTGSHFSAQNLAFMFGLLESCKCKPPIQRKVG